MRIARKTASVGGKSQKVTGTRRGIRFLRSENKIYKSQTLHITAVQGRSRCSGSDSSLRFSPGRRAPPSSSFTAPRRVPASPGTRQRALSGPEGDLRTATRPADRKDLPLLRTPGRPWPADQESRVVRKSTSALLRGRPQVCDRWRRSARSAARLGSREPAPPLEPRP